MKAVSNWLFCAVFFLAALPVEASPRVALMDFSTDDNSYRSAQRAADFTVLVQAKLSDVRTVEWVERSQLKLAETRSWIGSIEVPFNVFRGITAFAFSEQSVWFGGYGSLFRIEKNNVYSTPKLN